MKKMYTLDDKEIKTAFSPEEDENAPYTPLVLSLMEAMTWEEKFTLLSGTDDPEPLGQAGYLAGVPRLGVPPRRDADGDGLDLQTSQQGIFDLDVKNDGETESDCTNQSTSFPSRIGVAATFDRMASRLQGMIEGREGKAAGIDLLYAPQLDICRLPNFGRNNTTFGEDPYLSGQMGTGEVHGIQSQGIMAQIKHFLMYNGQVGVPFAGRPDIPTVVDDRTLHEIYLAPFEEVIKEAKPSSVMGSYQKYQVTPVQQTPNWACGNEHVLKTILRNQLDFRGFVLSDYGAAHSTDELLCGLDQQFMNAGPSVLENFGGPHFGANLRQYIDPESENFSYAYVQAMDRAVANVLYQYERFGLLACASPEGKKEGKLPPRPQKNKNFGIDGSLKIAGEAVVLLKNQDGILPIKENVKKAAVIGPTARQLMSSGLDAERSTGYHDRVAVSPLEQLQKIIGEKTEIRYAPGVDWYGKAGDRETFRGRFKRTDNSSGHTVIEDRVWYPANGQLQAGITYKWESEMDILQTGEYYFWFQQNYAIPPRFYGELWGYPQTKLRIDGREYLLEDIPVLRDTYQEGFLPQGGVNIGTNVRLEEGRHQIMIQTTVPEDKKDAAFQFTWSSFEDSMEKALEIAKDADIVLVFADDNGGPASIDTPVGLNQLAANQNEMIQRIAEENQNTVVIISSGNLVEMPWYDDVAAVLEIWYPGQEGSGAVADILTGKTNPSGHSPLTLPVRWEDTPFAEHPERYLGKDGKVVFSDTVFVGYRWYDEQGIKTRIPFGHGLSYSEFEYSKFEPFICRGKTYVSFKVKNISSREGTAVPQIYLGKPEGECNEVPYAKKSLVQFERVELEAGEEKEVCLEIADRAFEYWNTGRQKWIRASGKRKLYLCESFEKIILEADVPNCC